MNKVVNLYAYTVALIMCLPAQMAKRTKQAAINLVRRFDLGEFDWMLVTAGIALFCLWLDFVINMESIR